MVKKVSRTSSKQVAEEARLLGTSQDVAGQSADRIIAAQLTEWAGAPKIIAEWPALDSVEVETAIGFWVVTLDQLDLLRQWVAKGWLTPEQMARYREVEALAAHYEPTLRRLLSEESLTPTSAIQ